MSKPSVWDEAEEIMELMHGCPTCCACESGSSNGPEFICGPHRSLIKMAKQGRLLEQERYPDPESNRVAHSDEVVSFSKRISRQVASLVIPRGLDFKGASLCYVEEKLNTAINDLKWLKKIMREVDKMNRKAALDEERSGG